MRIIIRYLLFCWRSGSLVGASPRWWMSDHPDTEFFHRNFTFETQILFRFCAAEALIITPNGFWCAVPYWAALLAPLCDFTVFISFASMKHRIKKFVVLPFSHQLCNSPSSPLFSLSFSLSLSITLSFTPFLSLFFTHTHCKPVNTVQPHIWRSVIAFGKAEKRERTSPQSLIIQQYLPPSKIIERPAKGGWDGCWDLVNSSNRPIMG